MCPILSRYIGVITRACLSEKQCMSPILLYAKTSPAVGINSDTGDQIQKPMDKSPRNTIKITFK